ncbi:hypothetical protein BKA62DRAFT_695110 [Auriculariales sp. MPI-PUGE-AT-0066]|nr:hypothetical protein BKA62DRAFT_695110 [Auriculariales sp. MPI-PUGE-AT-0066]
MDLPLSATLVSSTPLDHNPVMHIASPSTVSLFGIGTAALKVGSAVVLLVVVFQVLNKRLVYPSYTIACMAAVSILAQVLMQYDALYTALKAVVLACVAVVFTAVLVNFASSDSDTPLESSRSANTLADGSPSSQKALPHFRGRSIHRRQRQSLSPASNSDSSEDIPLAESSRRVKTRRGTQADIRRAHSGSVNSNFSSKDRASASVSPHRWADGDFYTRSPSLSYDEMRAQIRGISASGSEHSQSHEKTRGARFEETARNFSTRRKRYHSNEPEPTHPPPLDVRPVLVTQQGSTSSRTAASPLFTALAQSIEAGNSLPNPLEVTLNAQIATPNPPVLLNTIPLAYQHPTAPHVSPAPPLAQIAHHVSSPPVVPVLLTPVPPISRPRNIRMERRVTIIPLPSDRMDIDPEDMEVDEVEDVMHIDVSNGLSRPRKSLGKRTSTRSMMDTEETPDLPSVPLPADSYAKQSAGRRHSAPIQGLDEWLKDLQSRRRIPTELPQAASTSSSKPNVEDKRIVNENKSRGTASSDLPTQDKADHRTLQHLRVTANKLSSPVPLGNAQAPSPPEHTCKFGHHGHGKLHGCAGVIARSSCRVTESSPWCRCGAARTYAHAREAKKTNGIPFERPVAESTTNRSQARH